MKLLLIAAGSFYAGLAAGNWLGQAALRVRQDAERIRLAERDPKFNGDGVRVVPDPVPPRYDRDHPSVRSVPWWSLP